MFGFWFSKQAAIQNHVRVVLCVRKRSMSRQCLNCICFLTSAFSVQVSIDRFPFTLPSGQWMVLVRLHGILEFRAGATTRQCGVSSLLFEFRGGASEEPTVVLRILGAPGLILIAAAHGALCLLLLLVSWLTYSSIVGVDRPRLCW